MSDTPIIPIEFKFDDADFKKLATQMEKLYKDAEKFTAAIKADKEVEKNNTKLKNTTKHMGEIANLQNKHAIAAKKTGGIIGGLKNKTKLLKTAIDGAMNPADVKRYNAQLVKTRKQITTITNGTRGWGKAMGSFQFKFNALGNIASNVASTITRKIGQALKDTVKTVIDFEKSFANVLTLLNKVDKVKYGDLLKGTSVAIMRKYGLAIEDTNKAMFDAISAGVKATDVFNVMDAAAKLAVGGVTDLNASVKGIASVLNAFSLSSSKALDVASAFFQAQKFGITYIDEMVASMGRANTIASLAGASYREMLAAFTAITKSGLNTEEAITGLRNVFKELVASSGEAAAELGRLGIATGSNAVQARGFIGVLDDLNAAYLKNNEIIPKIFGNIRGLTGIMGIVGERYKSFKFILGQVNDAMASNEALNDAVSTQMNTISKKLDILKSAWNTLWISIEDGSGQAGSGLKTLIEFLTETIRLISPEYFEQYTAAMADAGKTATSIVDGFTEAAKEQSKTEEERIKLLTAALEEEIGIREAKYKASQIIYLDELRLLDEKRTKEIELRQSLKELEPDSFEAELAINKIESDPMQNTILYICVCYSTRFRV
jgi:TP901 family phage tail tape measure protein